MHQLKQSLKRFETLKITKDENFTASLHNMGHLKDINERIADLNASKIVKDADKKEVLESNMLDIKNVKKMKANETFRALKKNDRSGKFE